MEFDDGKKHENSWRSKQHRPTATEAGGDWRILIFKQFIIYVRIVGRTHSGISDCPTQWRRVVRVRRSTSTALLARITVLPNLTLNTANPRRENIMRAKVHHYCYYFGAHFRRDPLSAAVPMNKHIIIFDCETLVHPMWIGTFCVCVFFSLTRRLHLRPFLPTPEFFVHTRAQSDPPRTYTLTCAPISISITISIEVHFNFFSLCVSLRTRNVCECPVPVAHFIWVFSNRAVSRWDKRCHSVYGQFFFSISQWSCLYFFFAGARATNRCQCGHPANERLP